MVSDNFPKSLNVSEETWEKIMRYRIVLKHKNIDETINWLIRKYRQSGVKK